MSDENESNEQLTDCIDKFISVSYADPSDPSDPTWRTMQVDGTLLAITPDAAEGVYLVIYEPPYIDMDEEPEPPAIRAIPSTWVLGVSVWQEEEEEIEGG